MPALVSISSVAENALELQPPVANDDSASTNANEPVSIDVLGNDFGPDGLLDSSSLTITSGPSRGTVTLQTTYLDPDDNGSPVGNGFGSAFSGFVNVDGRIKLAVSGSGDVEFMGAHEQSGDYALFVRLGEFDFSNFDPAVFDFQFTDNLTQGEADSFHISGQAAETPFIAWIDNTVGSGAPDTILSSVASTVVIYTPDPLGPVLVVDDPVDADDGDYSPGHLSLREAIFLANGTDHFRYRVSDNAGLSSNEATVSVAVESNPTTIAFAPRLTATLSFSLVGDTTADNHLGSLSLTNSTVGDIAKMQFLSTDDSSETRFVAPDLRPQPSAVNAPPRKAIVTAADGIRYALTPDRLLLRQFPGGNWSILDDLVVSYKIAPNGNCYWLNDRGDLLRSQAGHAGDLIGQLVQSFAMDQSGTVYDLSNGVGPGNFALYHSLTAPLLDPVEEHDDMFCMTPPTLEEVLQATGLAGPAIQNLRMVAEPIVDRLDGLGYFPNIGLARMHHCHYKVTVYYSTELNGNSEHVIYLDRDHLHRDMPGQIPQSTLASQDNSVRTGAEITVGSSGTRESSVRSLTTSATNAIAVPVLTAAAASVATVSDANRSDNIHSLWTGPDGTIYKLGGDYNGAHLVGQPPFPLVLWRLPPGGNWEPLLRVYAAEVAPDNTLFVLNTNHELQRLPPGGSEWTTVASGVQSFTMTKDGIVYALDDNGRLIRQQHAPRSGQWVLSTLDTGVRSFAVTADGVVYDLSKRNELKRLTGNSHRFVRIETGVTSLQQAADGTIYTLNQSGQLKRLDVPGSGLQISFLAPQSTPTLISRRDSNPPRTPFATPKMKFEDLTPAVESFQLDADGVLYALNRRHELTRLTAGGHWSLVDVDVQSFVLAPNGLRNIYILTTHHELKRLVAGYSWLADRFGGRILRTDAVSLSIDPEGVVTARDTLGRSWMYWSPFTVPVLEPIEGVEIFCLDPPSRDDVLRLTHIPDGPNVEGVTVEPMVDEDDPPRWFANLGNIPAVGLHHCHYRCTVYYTNENGPQTVVIDIDLDHLIRYVGSG